MVAEEGVSRPQIWMAAAAAARPQRGGDGRARPPVPLCRARLHSEPARDVRPRRAPPWRATPPLASPVWTEARGALDHPSPRPLGPWRRFAQPPSGHQPLAVMRAAIDAPLLTAAVATHGPPPCGGRRRARGPVAPTAPRAHLSRTAARGFQTAGAGARAVGVGRRLDGRRRTRRLDPRAPQRASGRAGSLSRRGQSTQGASLAVPRRVRATRGPCARRRRRPAAARTGRVGGGVRAAAPTASVGLSIRTERVWDGV